MLTTEEINICSRIMKKVSSSKTCGTLGSTFCQVPTSVITALRTNGFKVKVITSSNISEMDNSREFHNILVERKVD